MSIHPFDNTDGYYAPDDDDREDGICAECGHYTHQLYRHEESGWLLCGECIRPEDEGTDWERVGG